MRKSKLICIEIIDYTDVFVHIPHRENATCRTRVYLLADRNPFLTWQQCSRLAKVFLWSHFSGWVQKFCQELHNFIVNPHHLLPLSVQIVLWIILIVCDVSVSLVFFFGVVYTSLIDLWVLKVIFDLSLSVDCSPGGAQFLVWKTKSSHFAGTVITHEDFLT